MDKTKIIVAGCGAEMGLKGALHEVLKDRLEIIEIESLELNTALVQQAPLYFIKAPSFNLEEHLEDMRYSHLTKKEREANIVPVRSTPKIRRNDPCPCKSGKKYKNCCL